LVVTRGTSCTLKDMEGKILAKSISVPKKTLQTLTVGTTFSIGNYEIEIASELSSEEFLSGSVFLNSTGSSVNIIPKGLTKGSATNQSSPTSPKANAQPFKSPFTQKFKSPVMNGSTPISKPKPSPRYSPDTPGLFIYLFVS
jgi:hypothetical protein